MKKDWREFYKKNNIKLTEVDIEYGGLKEGDIITLEDGFLKEIKEEINSVKCLFLSGLIISVWMWFMLK